MNKGDRVEITGGRKGKGKTGTIFWKGPNKFGPGERFGVRGDDGETYWVVEDHVEKTTVAAPAAPEQKHTFNKGDHVKIVRGDVPVYGSVFWIGDSKMGGQRLGVRGDEDEQTHWIDARYCEPAGDDAPVPASPSGGGGSYGGGSYGGRGGSYGDDDGDAVPAEYAGSVGMDELPPMAPMDDAALSHFAPSEEEEDGGAW